MSFKTSNKWLGWLWLLTLSLLQVSANGQAAQEATKKPKLLAQTDGGFDGNGQSPSAVEGDTQLSNPVPPVDQGAIEDVPPGPPSDLPPPSDNPGEMVPPPMDPEEMNDVEVPQPPANSPDDSSRRGGANGLRRPPVGPRNNITKPSSAASNPSPARTVVIPNEDTVGADLIPDGQELVNIDFPEPTEIKDIIRAVSLWTGKNVILGRDVAGKVQMISPKKVTKVEAYQAFLSALNLLGLTTVETGKVIKIVPVMSAVKANLKTFQGASWTPMTDEFITQIVPLKYINAREIQTTLSRMVSSNSMIAYPPTNTLIISDSGFKVRRILDIIELLDVQTQQPKVSIVPIKYGDAKAIATLVGDIYKAQASGGKAPAATSHMSYRIMTDDRTNSVIIFGPPRTLADVKELVRKFDVQVDDPTRQSSIHVRPLDYADAKKLAATLSSLASGGRSSAPVRRPPMGGTAPTNLGATSSANSTPDVAVLDNDVKITADESSNALLITGSRAAYDALNAIIRKLDTRKSQVFVEAEILDLNITNGFSFGSHLFSGAKAGNSKTAVTWQASSLVPLIVAQASQAQSADKSLSDTQRGAAAQPFAEDFNVGILSGTEVDVPGLGKISPGALIKMIKRDTNTRVLSSPHILTSDNEVAKISVGDRLFFNSQESSSTGVPINTVKTEDVELSLEMKPNISHSNYVTLKVDLDASDGRIGERNLPAVTKRKTSQIVTVKNGQTVVISGLVKTSESESFAKIPLLGDIPIIGWLFRNSETRKIKNSLAIFLTPYIVHGANDLAAVYSKKIGERDELLRRIYGANYSEDEFYKMLPRAEHGAYRADAFDVIDDRRKEERNRETMRDLGYHSDDVRTIENQGDKAEAGDAKTEAPKVDSEDQTIAAPMSESGDIPISLDSGDDMGGDAPPLDPIPDAGMGDSPPVDFDSP